MDPLKKTSIPDVLSILKEKQLVQEKHFSFVQGILMDCEKTFDEEKRTIEEKYKKILEESLEDYKEKTDLLYERIDELKSAESEKEAYYPGKLIGFRGRISLLEENKRKNDEDLEVETALQATGATGFNNVESSQGKDEAIVLFDDPKLVCTSTGNSSGQSRHKDPILFNLASEHGNPSDKPESMHVRIMNDNDDELTLNEIAPASKRRQKEEVHVKGSSNSTQKRKRSTNEGQNNVGSSFDRKMTLFIPGLINPGNRSFVGDKEGTKWLSEDNLCSAFETDPELCLNAVCALYRQQISGKKFSKMSKTDKRSITALGVYLSDEDPENKLNRKISEVGPEEHWRCKIFAIRYCRQISKIYNSKKDRLFCRGAGIR